MKIIVNKFIPFKGFIAINLFGVLFVREENQDFVNKTVINHESIHTEQIKEMLYIFFYIWYGIEWLIKFIISPYLFKTNKNAYHNISFEQEAYYNEDDYNYLNKRKRYSWLKYILKEWKN